MWKHIPLFFFLLLLLPITLADLQTNYWQTGTGAIDSIDETTTYIATLDTKTLSGTPIPSILFDMDEDGTEELIAVNGNNIVLLFFNTSSSTLDTIGSYNTGADLLNPYYVSNMSGTPTIYYVTDDMWHTLRYNSTGDFIHNNMSHDFATTGGGFGCGTNVNTTGTDYCFYVDTPGTGASARIKLFMIDVTDPTSLKTGTSSTDTHYNTGCAIGDSFDLGRRHELHKVEVGDIDGNGLSEIAVSWLAPCTGAAIGNKAFISMLSTDLTTWTATNLDDLDCNGGNKPITAPLFYDMDSTVNGAEIYVGCMSGNNFRMGMFDFNLGFIDEFPEASYDDGTIISNVLKINCMGDESKTEYDVGVLGFDEDNDEYNFLCVNRQQYNILDFDSRSFSSYSVSDASVNSSLVYSADMGGSTDHLFVEGGVYSLSPTGVGGSMSLAYNHPSTGITMPVKFGDDPIDVLVVSPTNVLWYDDGYSNTNPSISYEIDPCNIICTDESPFVSVTLTDADGDNVRARVISYENGLNEQDTNWSSYRSSGSTFQFTFEANQSTSGSIVQIVAEDDSSDSTGNNTLEFDIIVNSGTGCHHVGECVDGGESVPTTTSEEAQSELDLQNNVDQNLEDLGISSTSGKRILATLLIIAVVIMSVWGTGHFVRSNLALLMIAAIAGIGSAYVFYLIGMIGMFFFILTTLICCTIIVLALFAGKLGGD